MCEADRLKVGKYIFLVNTMVIHQYRAMVETGNTAATPDPIKEYDAPELTPSSACVRVFYVGDKCPSQRKHSRAIGNEWRCPSCHWMVRHYGYVDGGGILYFVLYIV